LVADLARISPARGAAYKVLLAVDRGEAHSDELLRADAVSALSTADRNLTTTLVMGVLRWQLQIDQKIRSYLAKPNAKLDPEIRAALRLGAFQLLRLDRIPAHAAIDESVELAKQAGHKFAAGMVNAVLRNIAREAGDPGHCEEKQAYPAWMVERWEQLFGAEAACAICAFGQQQPNLSIRISDPSVEEELAAAGITLEPGKLLTAARTVIAGDVTATDAFRAGRVRIQDEGSQLVAEIAVACVRLSKPQNRAPGHPRSFHELRVLDACAAPGGKTLVLAERLEDAHIVACEASPLRHSALRARMAPLSSRVECWLADAAELAEEEAFDFVLVDAPCSGTGTLGRNPEIRHRLKQEDLARQSERQKAILQAALRAVKLDGRVVYSTCSLEPEENERVIASVIGDPVPIDECIKAMRRERTLTEAGAQALAECIRNDGALRLMPGVLGTDGFFVAVMERV
jgi:16S rRNA (cytosine967-C5)-methyltransferase